VHAISKAYDSPADGAVQVPAGCGPQHAASAAKQARRVVHEPTWIAPRKTMQRMRGARRSATASHVERVGRRFATIGEGAASQIGRQVEYPRQHAAIDAQGHRHPRAVRTERVWKYSMDQWSARRRGSHARPAVRAGIGPAGQRGRCVILNIASDLS